MGKYKEYFSKLNTARVKGQVAPHKAVMLLSVIDLFETEGSHKNVFVLDEFLEARFLRLWRLYLGESTVFKPVPATPFYHLSTEPFWSLYDSEGNEMSKLSSTPSIGYLRREGITAVLSDDLYRDMLSPSSRHEMRSLLVSQYLSKYINLPDDNEVSTDMSEELNSVIAELIKRLEKANSDNDSLVAQLHNQESITANLALQFKSEIHERDERIARLNNEVSDLKDTLDSLHFILDKVPKESLPETDAVPSGLDEYKFLKRVDNTEMPELPNDYRPIKYVYSKQDRAHYEILHSLLHENENMLSTLRVRLYEQYQADPDSPLLVCSCCKSPVLLTGNSGIKGEIVGFRHHGEINVRTGEHDGEYFGIPKQETQQELQPLKECLMSIKHLFAGFEVSDSFLLLPGQDRKNVVADVTFSLSGQRIAVICASVGHPLDFIIRRTRAAHEMRYLPIWILSSTYFKSSALSNRDISTFSKGFLCTIDEEAVGESLYNETPCIKVRDFYKKTVTIVKLSSFLPLFQDSIQELINSPEWIDAVEKVKRPRISKPKVLSVSKKTGTNNDSRAPLIPKGKKTVSSIDYWKGKRQHLKDEMFLERLDSGIGIVDLKTQRYPVLPIFDMARISDNNEVEFYLDGKISLTYKI